MLNGSVATGKESARAAGDTLQESVFTDFPIPPSTQAN